MEYETFRLRYRFDFRERSPYLQGESFGLVKQVSLLLLLFSLHPQFLFVTVQEVNKIKKKRGTYRTELDRRNEIAVNF